MIPKQKKLNIPVCPCHDVADYKPALPPLASVSYIRIMKDGLPADDSTSLAIEFTLTKADEAFADALAKKLGAASSDKVADAVAFGTPSKYKPNCNLVVIDHLVRQGFVSADAPGYVEMVKGLRV